MKLIYAQGFSKNEKLEWKPVVFNNIVQSFRLIFDAMNELDIKFDNLENEASPTIPPCDGAYNPGNVLADQLCCRAVEAHGSYNGGFRAWCK